MQISHERIGRGTAEKIKMKLYKLAVLPMSIDNPEFQMRINNMIENLFKENWEFDFLLTHGKYPIAIFCKDILKEETKIEIKSEKKIDQEQQFLNKVGSD